MRLFPTKFVLLGITLCYIDKNNANRATQFCTYWIPESLLEQDLTGVIASVHEPDYPIPKDWHPVIKSVSVLKTKWRWV